MRYCFEQKKKKRRKTVERLATYSEGLSNCYKTKREKVKRILRNTEIISNTEKQKGAQTYAHNDINKDYNRSIQRAQATDARPQ